MPENHSAQFYRGWLNGLREQAREATVVMGGDLPHVTQMSLIERADEIRALLVEAEAREAGEARGKKNADYWRGAVELLRQYKRDSVELTYLINQCLCEYEKAKAREAAPEVIPGTHAAALAQLFAERDQLRAEVERLRKYNESLLRERDDRIAILAGLRGALELLLKCNALGVAIPWGRAVAALDLTPASAGGDRLAAEEKDAVNGR